VAATDSPTVSLTFAYVARPSGSRHSTMAWSSWSGGHHPPPHPCSGACDMNAGVAANLAALAAIKRAGVVLRDTFALHFVIGEEDGGLGTFGTLDRGHTGRACIITEPTGGTLTTANAGALTFTIEVSELATHASTSYRRMERGRLLRRPPPWAARAPGAAQPRRRAPAARVPAGLPDLRRPAACG
jgi:hypothetical protein